jgi:glycosyltransferase involved in cell wall biosynthesis
LNPAGQKENFEGIPLSSEGRGRLLFVIGTMERGGAETHLSMVLPELVQRGWSVSLYLMARRGPLADVVERAGVKIIPGYRWFNRVQWMPLKTETLALMLCWWVELVARIWRDRPHVVHGFLPHGVILAGGATRLAPRGTRFFASRRSKNIYHQTQQLVGALERYFMRRADFVLGNSDDVMRELRDEGYRVARLRKIQNGIRDPRSRARVDLPARQAPLQLVMVANLIPYKGHRDLLEALASLCSSSSLDWAIWLIGAGRSEYLEELRVLARNHGLSERVFFLGVISDPLPYLVQSDIALLTSHEEGMPNAVLEAMACGLPVIGTAAGGTPEVIAHGDTGLVVPVRDPAAIAAAILSLGQNADLRKSFGAAGRARFEALYRLEACVQKYQLAYLERK